jgi:hypothetical protein
VRQCFAGKKWLAEKHKQNFLTQNIEKINKKIEANMNRKVLKKTFQTNLRKSY